MSDLISRQAAIDALHMHLMYRMGTDSNKKRLDDWINSLPPIQPKRGRWIRTGSGSLYDHYECSECGKSPKWECLGDNRWSIAFTDFCPNCGAKMEVNNESN